MNNLKIKNQNGFAHLVVILFVLLIGVLGFASFRVYSLRNEVKNKDYQTESVDDTTDSTEPEPVVSDEQPVESPEPPQATAPPVVSDKKPEVSFTTTVQIKGDATCQANTMDALKLLSTSAPSHYAVVIKYVGIIECASQGSGMFAYETPTRYVVGDATRNGGTVWYAGTIVHDAGHSKLYNDYLTSNPGQGVPNDIWSGEQAERTCLESQKDALSKIGASQSTLDYVSNIINSQYWDVPYDQRWW